MIPGKGASFLFCGVAGDEFALKFPETTFADGVAGIFHETEIKVEVVEGENTLRDDFSGAEAVTEESAGEACDVGVGILGKGIFVELEGLVFNVDGAIGCEGLSVAGRAVKWASYLP